MKALNTLHSPRLISKNLNQNSAGIVKKLALATNRSFGWIPSWFRTQSEYHKLRALNYRALKDIGLDGVQIGSSIEERIEMERRMKYRPGRHISLRR